MNNANLPPVVSSGPSYPATPQPPAKSGNRALWILLGVFGAMLLLCCGGIGSIAYFGFGEIIAEKPGIDVELTAFFNDIKNKDIDAAYSRFASTSVRQPKREFDRVFKIPEWQKLTGYASYRTTSVEIHKGTSVIPGQPPSTNANVYGEIRYDDGTMSWFKAVMLKDGEQWRVFTVNPAHLPWRK
jgi:hypothetical protein